MKTGSTALTRRDLRAGQDKTHQPEHSRPGTSAACHRVARDNLLPVPGLRRTRAPRRKAASASKVLRACGSTLSARMTAWTHKSPRSSSIVSLWRSDMALPFGVVDKLIRSWAAFRRLVLTSGARGCYRSVMIHRYRSVTSKSRPVAKENCKSRTKATSQPGVPRESGSSPCPPDLFHRHGIRGVGVETIAEAAGTNKMTLYRHFGSKDDLVLRVSELQGAKVGRDLGRCRGCNFRGDPVGQLYGYIGLVATIHRRGRAGLRSRQRRGRTDRGRASRAQGHRGVQETSARPPGEVCAGPRGPRNRDGWRTRLFF